MATTKEYHEFVMDQLARVGNFSSRRMMGEYCIYHGGKVIGLLCDNVFMIKPTDSVLRLMPYAERAYPYEGSRTLMVVVDEIENTELLSQVLAAQYPELPEPKEKRPSGRKAR